MKKIVCLVVVFVIMFAFSAPANALIFETLTKQEMNGVVVSSKDFGLIFSGDPEKRTTETRSMMNTSQLSVNSIEMIDDIVHFVIQIRDHGNDVDIPISGRMTSSYKAELGVNSIIVEGKTSVEGYKVLLVELFNDSEEDILLLESIGMEKQLQGKPHMKIYLQSDEGNLFLFEGNLPKCFEGISAVNYPRADSTKDALLWAKDLVIHNWSVIPDEKVGEQKVGSIERGLNATTRMEYGSWFYDYYYIATVLVESYSKPYVEMYHSNVIGGGGSPWVVRFKVEEYTETKGNIVYGQNPYRYVNVKIGFGTGDNTTINRYSHQGRIKKETQLGSNIIGMSQQFVTGVMQNALNNLPYGSTYQMVLQTLLGLIPVDKTVVFSNQTTGIEVGYCTAYGVDLSDYYFNEDTNHSQDINNAGSAGHYYVLQIYPLLEKNGELGQTTGAVYVHFDVDYATELTSYYPPFVSALSYETRE